MKTIITSFLTTVFTVLLLTFLYTQSAEGVANSQQADMKYAINEVYDATVFIDVTTNKGTGTGSGFVYDIEGNYAYIITNHHVIEDATMVKVVYANKTSIEANVVASDPIVDIAVLSVPKSSVLKVASMGDSDSVELGDKVITVGSPLGYDFMNSVTQGYVSGLDRTIVVDIDDNNTPDSKIDLIQIDAAINPGNSGGPLVDSKGNVIGVNTIKHFAQGVESMGFSIPINQAKEYADELVEYKKVIRPTFGIGYLDVRSLGVNTLKEFNVTHGIFINAVLDGRPAQKANIQKGDVIVSVNGVEIYDSVEFTYQLFKYNPGDEIEVEYFRNGEREKTTVMLDDSGLN